MPVARDGIQSRREADHLALELLFLASSLNENLKVDHSYQAIANLRQGVTLGKAEVIHINIGTRQDDRNLLRTWLIFPILQRDIHETIWYTLEKQFRIEHVDTIDTHRGIHLILSRGKLTYLLHKLLGRNIVYLTPTEGIGTPTDGISHTDLLAHNQVVGFHKTVLLGKDRKHVLIELKSEEDDEHTEEIGKSKACKLRYANMLSK